jgi:uncharacterized protein YeaO (DUF488 family)
VRKDAETWDAWSPQLGPSRELHAALYGKLAPPIAWPKSRRRYVVEMKDQRETIAAIAARVAAGETITLLCSSACTDPERWMIFCAAGDIHGALDRLYEDVLAFEATLAVRFAWALHVGDFGVWPDPDRIDKATRSHDGAGDFPRWLGAGTPAPRQTVFIKGNHEDFVWLDAQPTFEVLRGLFYLRNGTTVDLDDDDGTVLRVGGLGGCFGRSDYERKGGLHGYAKRHYTREEIERLSTVRGVDVMLVHDAPAGVRFEQHRRGPGWVSDAAGLDDLLASAELSAEPQSASLVITTSASMRWRGLGGPMRRSE